MNGTEKSTRAWTMSYSSFVPLSEFFSFFKYKFILIEG